MSLLIFLRGDARSASAADINPSQPQQGGFQNNMPVIDGVTVNDRQAAVYDVLKEYGPLADHALVPLAQHQLQIRQSSSGIRTRRAELMDKGLVIATTTTKTGSGRKAVVFATA